MIFMPGNGCTSSLSGCECGSVVESVWWVIELHLNFVVATLPQRQIPPAEDCPGPPGSSGFAMPPPVALLPSRGGSGEAGGVSRPSPTSGFTWPLGSSGKGCRGELVSVSVPCARDSQLF